MKRRKFVEQLGIGSAVLAAVGVRETAAQDQHGHGHGPLSGPLANVTVSFGSWPAGTAEEPQDRHTTPFAPVAPNGHHLLPYEVKIKAGGAVNFVVAGFHQVVVYGPGKKVSDINQSVLLPIPDAPPFIGLIDDPVNRIYRGLDPRSLTSDASPNNLFQDRVEVVGFPRRGTYLVICAVNVHLADGMFGWVQVNP